MSIPPERIRFLLLESCKLILRNAWMAAMCLEALNTSQYISYIRVNTPSSKCLAESGFAVPNFLPLPTQHRMKFLQSWCVSSHGHHPWPRDKPFLHRRFQFLAVDEAWEAPSAHGAKNGRNQRWPRRGKPSGFTPNVLLQPTKESELANDQSSLIRSLICT